MYIVQRRVVEIKDGWVTYELSSDPTRVIYRTVEQHREALKREPVLSEVLEFECYPDDIDGAFYRFKT